MKIYMFLVLFLFSTNAWSKINADFQGLVVGADESFLQAEETLNYATTDAERVAKAMRTAGRVKHGAIRQLKNPTLAEFESTIKKLSKTATKKFMFYFSGHSNENGLHLKDGSITKQAFHDMLASIPAKIKIVILDSCFSGALKTKGVRSSKALDLVQYDVDEPSGSVILTSSSGQELSYESQNLKGSIFTYHLVSGLYGQADGNNDGLVTIDELYQYVYSQTKYQSMVSGGSKQHPEFHSKLQGQGALVVAYPAKINGRVHIPKKVFGELTLASANGVTFFKFFKNKGKNKSVSVPSGNYAITVATNKDVGQSRVELLPNEDLHLKKDDFIWRAKTKEEKSKGISTERTSVDKPNGNSGGEWIFGIELFGNSGFGDQFDGGGSSELVISTPALEKWNARWRLTGSYGSQTNQLKDQNEEFIFTRTMIGFESNFNAFHWGNEWLVGLRVGSFKQTDTDEEVESNSISKLYLGARWSFKQIPIKLGLHLQSETVTDEEAEKEFSVSGLGVSISY